MTTVPALMMTVKGHDNLWIFQPETQSWFSCDHTPPHILQVLRDVQRRQAPNLPVFSEVI